MALKRDTYRVCSKHPEHETAHGDSPCGYSYRPCPKCTKASVGPPDFSYFVRWESGYIVEPSGTHTYGYTPASAPEKESNEP